ncbi:MAG: GNAT family N-acetyltransferase [Pirellulaceae bacterium]
MQVVQLEKVLAASFPGPAAEDGTVPIVPFTRSLSPSLWTRLHQAAFDLPRPWSDDRFCAEFNLLGDRDPVRHVKQWLWLAMGETSEHAIGAIGLRVDEHDVTLGHVRWLMVDARARRRGVARQLLAMAEKTAQQHGIERLQAETSTAWSEAIQFYQAHGFT